MRDTSGRPISKASCALSAGIFAGLLLPAGPIAAAECKPMLTAMGQQRVFELRLVYRRKSPEAISQAARTRAKEAAWTKWSGLASGLYGRPYGFEGNAKERRVICAAVPETVSNNEDAFRQRWQCRVWGRPCDG